MLYTNQESDSESELYYYNARYYNPNTGRFIQRDTKLGNAGDVLSHNRYIYVKNNPLKYTDPTGMVGEDVMKQARDREMLRLSNYNSYQSQWEIYEQDDPNMIDRIFGKKAGFEIGNGLSIWSQENKAVDYALSHPVQTGTAIGVTSGALIVGGAKAATALSVRYLGSVGTMCLWSCDKINVGDSFGRLGTVINNASGHITGFNHNGTYHGIDQIISRGVSPEVILKTVQSPTLRFSARFGRIGYLSKDAYIVLDSSGQVVTAIAQSNFYGTLLQVSNMIK